MSKAKSATTLIPCKVKEAVAKGLAVLQAFVYRQRSSLFGNYIVRCGGEPNDRVNRFRPPTFYPDEPKRRLIIWAAE